MIVRRVFDLPQWNLGPRRSLSEFEQMSRRMDQLFNAFNTLTPSRLGRSGVFPLINLTEDKENYYLRAELPGIKAEELDIQAEGGSISISGERKITTEGDKVKYHRREREAGRFSRILTFPGEIDNDKIEANLIDGILIVKAPKAEKAKPKQISVK